MLVTSPTVAFILARGGSKGIPRKNVIPLVGIPLIGRTIRTAIESQCFSRVIVSTDCNEIAAVALENGAEIPFIRPSELATDLAGSNPVVIHALDWLAENEVFHPETFMLLQPTSPLRTAEDIRNAFEIYRKEQPDAVVGVTPAKHPPQWLRQITSDGLLAPWLSDSECSQRQVAESLYEINGAIYLINTRIFREHQTFFPPNCRPYVMPVERSLDIDTPWDFHLAELLLDYESRDRRRSRS